MSNGGGKKTTITEVPVPKAAPPAMFQDRKDGMVEIEVDGAYRDQWLAKDFGPGVRERLRRAFGPGEYECRWVPPKGSDAEPMMQTFKIRSKDNGSDNAGVSDHLLRRIEAMEGRHRKSVDDEWVKVLQMQRDMASSNLSGVASVMEQSSSRMIEALTAMREADRERDERARIEAERMAEQRAAETRAASERELTRIEAHNRMMLETVQARIAAEAPKDPLEQVKHIGALVEAVSGLKPDAQVDWKTMLIQAAPELLKGASAGYGNIAEATDKIRRAKETEAALAAGQLPMTVAAGALPAPEAGPGMAASESGAPVPSTPHKVPEQLTAEDVRIALGIQFVEFLDHLDPRSWDGMLRATMASGSLPEVLVEPVRELYAGNPAPIASFLREIGAEDMIPKAAEVLRAAQATPPAQPLEPDGDLGPSVGVVGGGLDGEAGPGTD